MNLNPDIRPNAGDDCEVLSAFMLRSKQKQCGSRLTFETCHSPEFRLVCGYQPLSAKRRGVILSGLLGRGRVSQGRRRRRPHRDSPATQLREGSRSWVVSGCTRRGTGGRLTARESKPGDT
jgi:hypothetical protein